MRTYLQCPSCNNTNISQYRMPSGPIWCLDCGERDEQKEIENRFIITKEELKNEKI